jgi:hypothetical protein
VQIVFAGAREGDRAVLAAGVRDEKEHLFS